MNKFIIFLSMFAFSAAPVIPLCAQTIATTDQSTQTASDLEVMLQAVEATMPVPAVQLPTSGNFYSAQHYNDWPPLPGNVLGLPAWPLGDGTFLLDDANLDYVELAQLQTAAGSQMMDSFTPAFSFSTNDLWLQILSVTNDTANLVIHPP
jgi:hypothetical protein